MSKKRASLNVTLLGGGENVPACSGEKKGNGASEKDLQKILHRKKGESEMSIQKRGKKKQIKAGGRLTSGKFVRSERLLQSESLACTEKKECQREG